MKMSIEMSSGLAFLRLMVYVCCIGMCGCRPTHAGADSTWVPARAWVFSKGEHVGLITGETHLNTDLEFDNFYTSVLLPAYEATDIALMESQPVLSNSDEAYRIRTCSDEESGGGTGTPPAELLELVSQTSPDKELEHNTQVVKIVAQSILYNALIPEWVSGFHNRYPDLYAKVYPGPGLSFRLAGKSIENGSRPKVQGFVYQKDNWKIFCGASPEARRKIIIDEAKKDALVIKIAQSGNAEVARRIPGHLEAILTDTLSCVDKKPLCPIPGEAPSKHHEFLVSVGLMMPMDQLTFDMMVTVRNRVWLEYIERASSAHRRTFVVVGATHLPSFGTTWRTHHGMLDLLREHGYTVSPVRRYEDLAPYLNGSNQSLAKSHVD